MNHQKSREAPHVAVLQVSQGGKPSASVALGLPSLSKLPFLCGVCCFLHSDILETQASVSFSLPPWGKSDCSPNSSYKRPPEKIGQVPTPSPIRESWYRMVVPGDAECQGGMG